MTSEEQNNELQIVAVKFRSAGKLYDFKARGLELTKGAQVIVETDRGRALGTVVKPPKSPQEHGSCDGLKSVLRVATEADIAMALNNKSREKEAYEVCSRRIRERKMEMKLVEAEYLYDGSKIIFYFTADGRVDFRELVKDLAHHFHTRIEMRQIGVRDEAKMLGGIGVCGRELCCCTFLRKFDPVSVKMAKEQGLALNPNKISGQCGRLLCCLGYEYKTYCSMRKELPKCGSKVCHCGEPAEVIGQDVIAQKVTLRKSGKEIVKVPASELGDAPPKTESDESAQEERPKRGDASEKPSRERRQRPQRSRSRQPGKEKKRPAAQEERDSASKGPKPKKQQSPKNEAPADKDKGAQGKESNKPRRRRPRRRKPRTES